MYLNTNKSEIENFYDLLSQAPGAAGQRLDASSVDVTTGVNAVSPNAGNNFSNSSVNITGKAGTQFEGLGAAPAIFTRRAFTDMQGRHGNKIFVTNDDTQESIIQKICDRLKVPRSTVQLVGSMPRLPTGRGIESFTITLNPVVTSSSKAYLSANGNFTVVNNGPVGLPLQPTLFFGPFYVSRNVTLFNGTSATLSVYNTVSLGGSIGMFDNTIHGDESRSVNESLVLWINKLMSAEARRWIEFTTENTEVSGIYPGSGGTSTHEIFFRGKNATSPVTQTNGIGMRLDCRNYESYTFRNVPQTVISCEDIEAAREPVRKYLRLPPGQLTLTSFSKAAGTSILTINATNNTPCAAMPRTGSITMLFNPA